MKTALKIVGGIVGLLVTLVVVFLVYARFHDGPIAIIAGGPFQSGALYEGPEPDWSDMRTRQEVEFQLVEPARSRTTWIAEHEGKPYIVSGYMNTTFGKLWKKWPHEIEKDDRILLRVDDVIYERRLVRIMEGPEIRPVVEQLAEKYFGGAAPEDPDAVVRNGDMWLYEVAPRS